MSANIEAVLNNPLSISEADLDRLLAEQSGESVPPADDVGQDDEATEAKQGDETGGASAASEEAPSSEGKGSEVDPLEGIDVSKAEVLTKDGKHTIPYSVLQRARDEAAAATQLAQQERQARAELEAKIAELQQRATETPQQAAARGAPAVADVVDAESLEALREEAPQLAEMIERLAAAAKASEERAAAAERTAQEAQQREQARARDAATRVVEDAIANSPKLLWTRSEKPEVYNRIVDFDNFLRASEEGRTMDLPTRLDRAIAMYEAVNGEIKVPGSAKPVPKVTQQTSQPELRVPSTLSDLPGGSAPAKSDAEQIGDLSGADLTQMMMKMTEAEQQAFLARVAL